MAPALPESIEQQIFNAVYKNDEALVTKLLATDPPPKLDKLLIHPDYDATAAYRLSALNLASGLGYVEMCRILLNHGATPEFPDDDGKTPLHRAFVPDSNDLLELLVSKARDKKTFVNTQDKQGQTALHMLCRNCRGKRILEAVECLLGHGADCTIRAYDGRTVAHCLYMDRGLDALRRMCTGKPKLLGLEAATLNRHKDTVLHLASINNQAEIVKWLLDNMTEGDIRKETSTGETAWQIASGCGDSRITGPIKFNTACAFAQKERSMQTIHPDCEGCEMPMSASPMFPTHTFFLNNVPGLLALLGPRFLDESLSLATRQYFVRDLQNVHRISTGLGFREPTCIFEPIQHVQNQPAAASGPNDINLPEYVSIVMPVLGFETSNQLGTWRTSGAPGWTDFIKKWKYCYSDKPGTSRFYPCLTLDEYCYQHLSEQALARRNCDQVILSIQGTDAELKEPGKQLESVPPSYELVVVHQAWIWRIHDMSILSGGGGQTEGPLLSVSESFKNFHHVTDSRTRMAIMMTHLAHSADRGSKRGNIFRVFENAVSILAAQVDTYLQTISIQAISIETEKALLHRIIDIQEELSMIKRVIQKQEEVWTLFMQNAYPDYWSNEQEGRMMIAKEDRAKWSPDEAAQWKYILSAPPSFARYYTRIAQLNEDAERVERSVTAMLDLKSKHAAMREAHSSAIMSAAVVGFTIVTIIFTPLAFVISLLALPIEPFVSKRGVEKLQDGAYKSRYVKMWAVTTEFVTLAVTFLLMWLAIKVILGESIIRRSFWAVVIRIAPVKGELLRTWVREVEMQTRNKVYNVFWQPASKKIDVKKTRHGTMDEEKGRSE